MLLSIDDNCEVYQILCFEVKNIYVTITRCSDVIIKYRKCNLAFTLLNNNSYWIKDFLCVTSGELRVQRIELLSIHHSLKVKHRNWLNGYHPSFLQPLKTHSSGGCIIKIYSVYPKRTRSQLTCTLILNLVLKIQILTSVYLLKIFTIF